MLRIVAMLSIVVGHVFYHGFHNECTDVLWLRPFTCCGVNIFVLISGYYGINFKLKSLFSLLFMVSFYTICSGIIEYFCWGNVFSLSRMSGVLLPFTGNHYYWFVTCYIYLYLLSPILNQGVLWLYDNCYLKKACVILLYVNFVGGWLLSNSLINKDGFNVMHFVFLYLLGRSFCLYKWNTKLSTMKLFASYIILFLVGATNYGGSKLTDYNSPLMVAIALVMLCAFLRLKIQNKVINKIAKTMFAVYLLQDGIAGQSAYELVYHLYSQSNIVGILFYVLSLFLIAYILEVIRFPIMNMVFKRIKIFTYYSKKICKSRE